jgi:hypothetical protein
VPLGFLIVILIYIFLKNASIAKCKGYQGNQLQIRLRVTLCGKFLAADRTRFFLFPANMLLYAIFAESVGAAQVCRIIEYFFAKCTV